MIRLCINTQTPPIRLTPGHRAPAHGPWRQGVDYVPNIGGVVPMMRALLSRAVGSWVARDPRWVALGAADLPEELVTDEGYTLEMFDLPQSVRTAYGRFKEAIWRSFHGPQSFQFPHADYLGFVEYNYAHAERLLRHAHEYDLFYVNDFQQLLVGGLIGSAAPALLRWHIPIDLRGYPEPVRRFFLRSMEGFDAIVVSTRAGLEELIRAGFRGRAFQLYPYIDPSVQRTSSPTAIAAFRNRWGLPDDAPVILSVARLDPVKRQDLLLEAMAQVRRRHPTARLLLVGGGSFSTRTLRQEGVPTKAEAWGDRLRHLVHEHGLDDAVIFAGALSDADLQTAYSTATMFVHSAPWEGFGLVVVEAWSHRLPVIVSRGAGVAEIIDDEASGLTVPPGSSSAIAQRINQLLDRPERAARIGEVGALIARRCYVDRAAPRLREIFERAIRLYEYSGLRPELRASRAKA